MIAKSKTEVNFTMTTNILETLPWIDYQQELDAAREEATVRNLSRIGELLKSGYTFEEASEIVLKELKQAQPVVAP